MKIGDIKLSMALDLTRGGNLFVIDHLPVDALGDEMREGREINTKEKGVLFQSSNTTYKMMKNTRPLNRPTKFEHSCFGSS
jgi:hypothetical protein